MSKYIVFELNAIVSGSNFAPDLWISAINIFYTSFIPSNNLRFYSESQKPQCTRRVPSGKDMSRSCGCIATTRSYLPFPQFLPSDGNNWYYSETESFIFFSNICYKFLRKQIRLHCQEIQNLYERWGGSAVICHWQWQITFRARYRVTPLRAEFWMEGFVLIT